tara:strand:+ start:73 stop:750 length:678 start_codon:yes stop_codon:yes gene_type:complete
MQIENNKQESEFVYIISCPVSALEVDGEPPLVRDLRDVIKGGTLEVHPKKQICKIGMSTQPMARIHSLKNEMKLPFNFNMVIETTGLNTRQIEKEFHQCFRKDRIRHEYFYIDPKDFLTTDTVQDVISSHGIKECITDINKFGAGVKKSLAVFSPQNDGLALQHEKEKSAIEKKYLMLFNELLMASSTCITTLEMNDGAYYREEREIAHKTYISQCKEIVQRAGV